MRLHQKPEFVCTNYVLVFFQENVNTNLTQLPFNVNAILNLSISARTSGKHGGFP